MAGYRFVTVWRLRAPIERVYATIDDAESWPAWWPSVRSVRAWMDLLAPLPFVDAIFRLNHHAVMRDGLAGLRRRLGGVEGSYTREA